MIPYSNEHSGLRDFHVPISGVEKPPGKGGWRLLLLLVVAALITAGVLYFR